MTTYTTTADANGDFSVNFGKVYNGGESITVKSTKMGQSKEILLSAPVGEYEPLPPVFDDGSLRITGSFNNFPNDLQKLEVTSQLGSSIPNSCFYDSNFFVKFKALEILEGVTSVGQASFQSWRSSKSLTLPSSLKTIGDQAFQGWTSCTSVTFASGVTSIGQFAFDGWRSCPSLTLPNTLTTIGNSAFQGWSACTSLTLPSILTAINNSAFSGWASCPSLTLPSSLTNILYGAFDGWRSCTRLEIPSMVVNIGAFAFQNWTACTEVVLQPTTPPTILSNTFSNLPSTCIIKVPQASLATYQTAPNWSQYASQMVGI